MTVVPRTCWVHVEGDRFPLVWCPHCGNAAIGGDPPHGISADGHIFESVICSQGCGFHDYVRLEGWDCGEVTHR